MSAHKYVPADLGHSHYICLYCSGTPMENAALGESNHCSKAPTAPLMESAPAATQPAEPLPGPTARPQSIPKSSPADEG